MIRSSPEKPGSLKAARNGALMRAMAQSIEQGQLEHDAAQIPAIDALDGLLEALQTRKLATKGSALGWLFAKKVEPDSAAQRGLYLWGGVGRGKSMLMDLFFDQAPIEKKRRVHFHAFMQDVHARIHTWRQENKSGADRKGENDPIVPVADDLARQASLLCFDEFAVTDVADAMILARMFTQLFKNGVTIVATSNVAPDLLYRDGLNRSFFLPFIELVITRMQVLELASQVDYRMEKLINTELYMTGKKAAAQFDSLWDEMTSGLVVAPAAIEVAGRETVFPLASGGLVRTHFDALCREALGAGDYLALCDRFHTLFLEGVPAMDHSDRNAAKRFIALIDTLYDKKRALIVQAETSPSRLYSVDHGTEAFEFQRTTSRLQEMQSDGWLATA